MHSIGRQHKERPEHCCNDTEDTDKARAAGEKLTETSEEMYVWPKVFCGGGTWQQV